MNAPTHLTHKPIISVNNYNQIDGQHTNDTDAEALSLGFATFNNNDLSIKVWRYDKHNKKWSRQSEELPLHRVLDLSILLLASLIKDTESDFPISTLKETFNDKKNEKFIREYLKQNKKRIVPRIKELERLIKEFQSVEKRNY